MNRKIKIMGIYIMLLFFVSILLILITSFTNTKFEPSYNIEQTEENYNTSFEQKVNNITEYNMILMKENMELKKQLEEKTETIKEYKQKFSEIKNIAEKIDRQKLSSEYQEIYDNVINNIQ